MTISGMDQTHEGEEETVDGFSRRNGKVLGDNWKFPNGAWKPADYRGGWSSRRPWKPPFVPRKSVCDEQENQT